MLLTLSTTHRPAADLGYLLAKHPAKFQSFELAFGMAHVFYTEASEERCEVALLLEVDPVGLVRGRTAGAEGLLDQYVNDRPYAASSFLSVAIAQVFGSALGGRSKGRQELAETAIPLEARLPVLPCRGGEDFLRRLFEPLGYEVEARRLPLDEAFPEWGESPYVDVTLRRTATLREFLTHLYVLVPVLDDEKHYYVGTAEVEKLLRFGEGWLASHPEREAITRRYLKHSFRLTREALARLVSDEAEDPDADEGRRDREEEAVEERISLNQERAGTVLAALKGLGARRVLDLGCGDGKLLARLFDERSFEEIVGGRRVVPSAGGRSAPAPPRPAARAAAEPDPSPPERAELPRRPPRRIRRGGGRGGHRAPRAGPPRRVRAGRSSSSRSRARSS